MQTINDKQKYKLQQLFEMLSVSLDIGMESFSPLVKSEIVSVCIGLIYDKLHIWRTIHGFSRTIMFCGDIRTEIVENERNLFSYLFSFGL